MAVKDADGTVHGNSKVAAKHGLAQCTATRDIFLGHYLNQILTYLSGPIPPHTAREIIYLVVCCTHAYWALIGACTLMMMLL